MTGPDVNFPIALDIVGVSVGAVQGAFFARTLSQVSAVGVGVFAFLTALGGAMIRDALMAQPSAALSDPYLIAWAGATLFAFLVWQLEHRLTVALVLLDTVYLGVWTVAGSDKAFYFGFGVPAAILLGVITGVGGGVLRDLLSGQMPTIFQGGPLYTVAALVGAGLFAGLHEGTGLPRTADALVSIGVILVIRSLSLHYRWLMPAMSQLPPPRWAWWRRSS